MLTSITWPYRRLKLRAHWGQFFLSRPLTRYWFSIGLQAQPRLIHLNVSEASFFAHFLWLDAATLPYYINESSCTVNAFRVQLENVLEDVFFLHFSLVSIQFHIIIMISVVHTAGYAVIQVKHRRDLKLKLSVLRAAFFSVFAIFGISLEVLIR